MTIRVLCALIVLATGVYTIVQGARENNATTVATGVGLIAAGIGLVTP